LPDILKHHKVITVMEIGLMVLLTVIAVKTMEISGQIEHYQLMLQKQGCAGVPSDVIWK